MYCNVWLAVVELTSVWAACSVLMEASEVFWGLFPGYISYSGLFLLLAYFSGVHALKNMSDFAVFLTIWSNVGAADFGINEMAADLIIFHAFMRHPIPLHDSGVCAWPMPRRFQYNLIVRKAMTPSMTLGVVGYKVHLLRGYIVLLGLHSPSETPVSCAFLWLLSSRYDVITPRCTSWVAMETEMGRTLCHLFCMSLMFACCFFLLFSFFLSQLHTHGLYKTSHHTPNMFIWLILYCFCVRCFKRFILTLLFSCQETFNSMIENVPLAKIPNPMLLAMSRLPLA